MLGLCPQGQGKSDRQKGKEAEGVQGRGNGYTEGPDE